MWGSCPGSSGAGASSIWTRRTSRPRSARTWRLPPRSRSPTASAVDDARYAALKEFGNVTQTTEAARRVWTPRWLGAARSLERHPLRHPRARQESRVLAHGHRRPDARHRAQRHGLHHAQGPGADPDRRRRVGGGIACSIAETDAGRIIRISYPDYQHIRDNDRTFSGLMASGYVDLNVGRGRGARQVSGEIGHGQLLSGPRRSRAAGSHAASRRTKSLRAGIRSSSSATGCGGVTSVPTRTSSARRST